MIRFFFGLTLLGIFAGAFMLFFLKFLIIGLVIFGIGKMIFRHRYHRMMYHRHHGYDRNFAHAYSRPHRSDSVNLRDDDDFAPFYNNTRVTYIRQDVPTGREINID